MKLFKLYQIREDYYNYQMFKPKIYLIIFSKIKQIYLKCTFNIYIYTKLSLKTGY